MNLEKLVLEYQNGKDSNFDSIYKETLPIVRAAILNYITERETVLDLIQDTYLVFIGKRDSYNSKSFRNWIYTIAKNKALDYLKKRKEILLDDEEKVTDESISPCIRFVINNLPSDKREVFLLKVLLGYSSKKVASYLNMEINQVNKLYYEAKEILREELKDYEIK